MPIENIPFVMQYGILSHECAKKIRHSSVAMTEIQKKRDKIQVPGGLRLHQYANLYFDARNPMMFKRKEKATTLCILKVSVDVLDLADTVITDQNASSGYVRFLSPKNIELLNFDRIYAENWRHADQIQYFQNKSAKCAEVLVPHCVEPKLLLGAYVVNNESKNKLKETGFTLPITIAPDLFFHE